MKQETYGSQTWKAIYIFQSSHHLFRRREQALSYSVTGKNMKTNFFRISALSIICLLLTLSCKERPTISHGPMLGAVSESTARIWVRTTLPGKVTCTLTEIDATSTKFIQKDHATPELDNTLTFSFDKLKGETRYGYKIRVGKSAYEGYLTTTGPSLKKRALRMVYGYGYMPSQDKTEPGTSSFMEMALREPDLTLFLGDFPYTSLGQREEVRDGNKELRAIVGFRQLTASTPTYGIYDDHDFGPNDCDGDHPFADEALAAFKEYWPNPSYGQPDNKGIYCSFVVGDVEFFLLDGRYQARKNQGTMLGAVQFTWLCEGLRNSKCRYKVLVSGTQFGRIKGDSWAGEFYLGERQKLFDFIFENGITGVIGISGDVHRSDIYKLPIGGNRFFYDFTPGALARIQRTPPEPMPPEMIHSYGRADDNNMFGEIEFRPSSDKEAAIIFRSFSTKNGLVYEFTLSPENLDIQTDD